MKNNRTFFFIIGSYFALLGLFHFVRMALEWKIIIVGAERDYEIITLVSAICILFSVFVIYYIAKNWKIEKKTKPKITTGEEENNEKEQSPTNSI